MRKLITIVDNIIRSILKRLYRLAGRELTEEQWRSWEQFIGFCLVGVSNFLVSYGTYALFLWIGTNYHVANVMAFILSVLNAYFWNNRFVFRQGEGNGQRTWWKTLIKTYLTYAFSGLILTELLLFTEINLLGVPKLLAPVINLVITTPINFIINKLWTFKTETITGKGE